MQMNLKGRSKAVPDSAKTLINNSAAFATGNILNVVCNGWQ
jgi:hypothetical protein